MAVVNMDTKFFNTCMSEEKRPVLVEFGAPWCVYCRRLEPVFDRLSEEFGDRMVAGKLDIDESPEIADREEIEAVPTIILYKEGKRLGTLVAPESKDQVKAFVGEHLPEFGGGYGKDL